MKFEVTPQAAQWYIKELHLNEGDSIKFFGKVYGTREGFSFAITKEPATNPYKVETVEGIHFYIEKTDQWFFEDISLVVALNKEGTEPEFNYEENK